MLTSVKALTRALKSHDAELFAQETKPGRVDVYRANRMFMHPPHYVFSLTEDWTVNSRPVPWGIDVVVNRIKAHDLWRDDQFVERLLKDQEKAAESEDRAFRNNVEGFLSEFRSQFHKATNGINTSTLNKVYRKEL